MSRNPRPIPLIDADRIAAALAERLAPHCERFEVAGSVRRRKLFVGDVGIVCIPRTERDLLDQPIPGRGPFYAALDALAAENLIEPASKNEGDRFKKFRVPCASTSVGLDLFLVRPETWGFQLAIRTGPESYSKAIVTNRARGGLLRDDVYPPFEGRVRDKQTCTPLDVPEEQDYLELCGGWIDPQHRGEAAVDRLRRQLAQAPDCY